MSLVQGLLGEFDHETAVTRKVLARVPADKLDYAPHPKSMTMARLGQHLVDIPSWIGWTLNTEVMDMLKMEAEFKPGPLPTSTEELLATFDKNVAAGRAALAGASEEQLFSMWRMVRGEQELLALPKVAVLRGFVFSHAVHHRAQMALYLRLLDVPVPAIYGPSADESPWQ
jgi:uncharacterized damage-inducible protein DinB